MQKNGVANFDIAGKGMSSPKSLNLITEIFTGNRGSFHTAFKLSLDVAPSGQSNLAPRLKYFSERRLQEPF